MESNLLYVGNQFFGGIIRNYPHIFKRVLVLAVWFDVVFSVMLCCD